GLAGVSVCPGPNSCSTCASVKWQWRAEMLTTSRGFCWTPALRSANCRWTICRTICSTARRSIVVCMCLPRIAFVDRAGQMEFDAGLLQALLPRRVQLVVHHHLVHVLQPTHQRQTLMAELRAV